MPTLEDQVIECRDCGEEFTWTAGQQEFYAKHKLNPPKRCDACRQERRNERERRD